jgi:hypothetical protein
LKTKGEREFRSLRKESAKTEERRLSGHKQRFEGETVGKADAFPSIPSALRLKREFREAVAAQSEVASRVLEGVYYR